MSTIVSALLPNTQFTQAGIANKALTPLVNNAIVVEGQPKVWLCDASGYGSLHTLDYSGNPSEIIICPNSAPNTTTKRQQFMYYRNIGGNWSASSTNYDLPWVPWGEREVIGLYANPSSVDGLFLWTNFTTQAPPRSTVAPYPLTINTNVPTAKRCHWASICTSNGALSVPDQVASARADALFGTGANLISPSYALVACHDAPVKFWFQLPDGTEISRVRGNVSQIAGTDLGITPLLNTSYQPWPIYEIEPPVIPINPEAFTTTMKGIFMELGGRVTTMGPDNYLPFSPTLVRNRIRKQFPMGQTGPVIQDGNSGHPFSMEVAGTTFLLGAAHQGGSYSLFNEQWSEIWFPNVSKYITEINAVLAARSECLQTARVFITG